MMLFWFSLTQDAFAGATVSTFKSESRKPQNYWNGGSAIDGDPKTAWMVPGEGGSVDALAEITGEADDTNKYPRGEWIELEAPSGSVSTVESISMIVGYAIDAEKFKDYARIKSVRIDVYEYNKSMKLVQTDRTVKVNFEDKIEMQNLPISGIDIKSEMGGKFRITVTDIYEGKDYDSFAISELMLYMKDYDAHKVNISDVEHGADGSVPEKMSDKNTKTYWLSEDMSTLEDEKIRFGFDAGSATLSRMSIVLGPKSYARPKTIKVYTGGRFVTQELADSTRPQWVWIPSVTGYSGSTWDTVYVEVLDTYPGSKSQQVGIAEIGAKFTSAGL
jgi:hypothetical protein